MRIPETETGEFLSGNPATGKPGSVLTTAYMNSDLREKLNILRHVGIKPDPNDDGQLIKAIQELINRSIKEAVWNRAPIYHVNALPATDIGPIIVAECSEVWNWVAGQYFTGYRSPLCGRPLDGHTAAPLASEVDAVGGLLSKADYAALWGYAQEQGLVKTEAEWQANRGAHWFTSYSETHFRVPDLRDMFRRYTGTDADTANARALGSAQIDMFKAHSHTIPNQGSGATSASLTNGSGDSNTYPTGTRGGAETRPVNTAYHPRIHA